MENVKERKRAKLSESIMNLTKNALDEYLGNIC